MNDDILQMTIQMLTKLGAVDFAIHHSFGKISYSANLPNLIPDSVVKNQHLCIHVSAGAPRPVTQLNASCICP